MPAPAPDRPSLPATLRPALPLLALAALASAYSWAVFITTFRSPGLIGINYVAPGSDYMVFHTAAALARAGDFARLHDGDAFTALLNQIFGSWFHAPLPFRPWIYPPLFLLLLLPFGQLGFAASYAAFQLAGAAAFLASMRAGGAGRAAALVAVASLLAPGAAIVAVAGQSSFWVAAALTAGVRLLPRRPIAAGLLLGLLCAKPQFALLVPVILLAARAYAALLAAAASVLAMTGATLLLYGPAIWRFWLAETLASGSGQDPRWFLYGRVWGSSAYTCAVLLGAAPALAQAVQLAAIALAAAMVWLALRRLADWQARLAVVLAAALLAAPHWGGYDTVLLAQAALLWLTLPGIAAVPQNRLLVLLAWLLPLFNQPALSVPSRFLPLLLAGFMLRVLATAQHLPRPRAERAA